MVHPNKKRKRNQETINVHSEPTEEERKLEAQLFGRTFDTSTQNDIERGRASNADNEDAENDLEPDLEQVSNDQLFFFDSAAQSSDTTVPKTKSVLDRHTNANQGPSLWNDPADENLSVSLKDSQRLRKLRKNATEDIVDAQEYQIRLRQQFEKVHPVPSWANYSKPVTTSSSLPTTVSKSQTLKPGPISLRRLRNVGENSKEGKSKNKIHSLEFHPEIQILYTTSHDRKLRLYQIDGTQNSLLQTLHLPELPFGNTTFHPLGSSILLTGPRPYYYTYNLQTGTTIQHSSRNLWTRGNSNLQDESTLGGIECCKFSHSGDYLALSGRAGQIRLLDWKNGKGDVISEFKVSGTIKGLTWSPDDGKLLTVTKEAEIFIWDIRSRRCTARWKDAGGFAVGGLECDKKGEYVAIGSNTGIVNFYSSSSVWNSAPESTVLDTFQEREPLKTIMNLTTNVSSMKFNHDAQILALASNESRDQLKLLHTSNRTVFSNWPTAGTPLGKVTSIDFSKRSEYLAIGNEAGKVLLYTLDHFNHIT